MKPGGEELWSFSLLTKIFKTFNPKTQTFKMCIGPDLQVDRRLKGLSGLILQLA